MRVESVDSADELPGALLLKLQKIQILNFEKNKQKYQSVVYDLFYLRVNLYYEISCILALEKITKFQIWEQDFRSRNMFQILSNLSFLLRL
jgi:hypothetical protein